MKYSEKRSEFFNKQFSYKPKKNPMRMSLGSKKEFEAFLGAFSMKKGAYLIDIGCGDGRFALPLIKMGFKVTGVDIAQDALDSMKLRAKEFSLEKNLKLVKSDFRKPIPELQGKYDGAYIISTLHMLSNDKDEREKIFKNFVKTVKKGGKVLILESNPLNPLFYPFYLFSPTVDWNIEKTFLSSNRWQVAKLMSKSGLGNIKVHPYGFAPGFTLDKLPFLVYINQIFSLLPIVRLFTTFNFFVAEKI